jgi:hypothetical protein
VGCDASVVPDHDPAPDRPIVNLPRGYPSESVSDDELALAISKLIEGWRHRWSGDDLYLLKGEITWALVTAGVVEQSRRDARKASRLATGIAIVAAIAAALALAVIVFDYRSNERWRDDQTKILTAICKTFQVEDGHC